MPTPLLTVAFWAVLVATPALLSGITNYSVDGVASVVGPFVFPEDTVYASKYTLTGWKQVRVGMSRSEVEEILGPAQSTYSVEEGQNDPDTGSGWSYSPGDTHFRRRVLLFREGIVVVKYSEYHID